MLDHAVWVDAKAGLALRFSLEAGPDVHPARIEPHEERLFVAIGAIDETHRRIEKFFVDRLHALLGERPGVLASLLAPCAETGIVARRGGGGSDALHNATGTELR